ncbi:MAG TPA: TIGR03067 domain-containing protein [Isosphaeraceae bacterium]|nr:TIGR03067 domain-containing protein [Isosphaeraceae bacterium]
MRLTNRMGMHALATGRRGLLVVAVWAGQFLGGGAARAVGVDDPSPAEALKALQGTWVPFDDQGIDSKWTFENQTLKASVNGADYTCKVKVDPAAKPNATIDLVIDEGPEGSQGKTSKGIYKFQGEKLMLCVSMPGKDRPTAFETAEDEAYFFPLKKEKKGEAKEKAATDKASSAEALKALQGTWVPSDDQGIDSKWTFEGQTLKATVNGIDYTCKIKVDPAAQPHATIDIAIEEGPEESKGKASQGLYKLAGDKLTLCVSLPGKDRPKAFETTEGEAHLFELKKEPKN